MYVFDGSLCTAMTLGFGHLHVPSAKTRVAWDAASAGMYNNKKRGGGFRKVFIQKNG